MLKIIRRLFSGTNPDRKVPPARPNLAFPLINAATTGDFGQVLSILRELTSQERLKYGSDALKCAAGGGHVEIVRILLGYGAKDENGEALQMARYFCRSEVESLLLGWSTPPGRLDRAVQEEFDHLWLEASAIEREQTRRGIAVEDAMFVKRHVYLKMTEKHDLSPEDFERLEINFRQRWHPSFGKGWERN